MARALLAGIVLFVARSESAADIPWLTDRPLAVRQAAEQGKLLLVIDLSGDFLVDPATAPEAKAYRALAISDRRVAELLASRFIVTFRHVGPSAALQSTVAKAKGERPLPPADYALAFVCLPSQRVLHFIPGLVTADALLAELKWADACNRERLRTSPDEQEWFVHEKHRSAALPADRKAFFAHSASKWRDGLQSRAPLTLNDLLAAMRAAKAVRDQSLIDRLKPNWTSFADQRMLLAALAAHGDLEPTLAHLVLAEFPLPRLAEIERPLYEIASGQRFWQPPPGGNAVLAWWADVRKSGTATLLVVRDDPFYAAELGEGERLVWPPLPGFRLTRHLRAIGSRIVTLDELAMLVAGAGLEPIRFTAGQSPPRYVVHDARGFRLVQLSAREGTNQRLAQTLNAMLNPGDVAAASGAGGVPTDEED
jgi:hypothetical protein